MSASASLYLGHMTRHRCATRLGLAAVVLLGMLTGCSGAPDADDIQPLLQQQLRERLRDVQSAARTVGGEQGVQFMRALGAPDPEEITVDNVRILESRALEHDDHALDVRYDIVTGERSRVETATLYVNRSDDGWRLVSAPSR